MVRDLLQSHGGKVSDWLGPSPRATKSNFRLAAPSLDKMPLDSPYWRAGSPTSITEVLTSAADTVVGKLRPITALFRHNINENSVSYTQLPKKIE